MGTPEFASVVLESVLNRGEHEVCAVVTIPDKRMGRGLKLTPSAVKIIAEKYNIPVLQPEKLKDGFFLEQLKKINADLFLVVAFRMLPEAVWRIPEKGTLNLHASLLPKYRGAAPIHRSIMNGEKETGVTTFFIDEHIDEGDILLARKIFISEDENAGKLYDDLLDLGKIIVNESLNLVESGNYKLKPQAEISGKIPMAPKIFKEDCKINWSNSAEHIYNQIRGLSPYPGAFTIVKRGNDNILLKVFSSKVKKNEMGIPPGQISVQGKNTMYIGTSDDCIEIEEVQLFGKRRMSVRDFLTGNKGFDGLICE